MRISDWSSDVCSSDLEERYFADAEAFWSAQNAAITERRAAYLEAGWSDVVIVPPSERFDSWEYEKAAKRKGGRVYIDVRAKIGRASCRGRVCQYVDISVVAVDLKKKLKIKIEN